MEIVSALKLRGPQPVLQGYPEAWVLQVPAPCALAMEPALKELWGVGRHQALKAAADASA